MISAMIEALLATQIAAGLGILVVLAVRRPVRQAVGARLAFGLWALPVIAGLAVMAPGPFYATDAVQLAAGVEAAPVTDSEAPGKAPGLDSGPGSAHEAGQRELTIVSSGRGAEIPAQVWIGLWVFGSLATALTLAIRQYRFHRVLRPMRSAPELGPDVFRAGSTHVGAGLVGALRPKIIVPADFEARFSAAEIKLILEHEREHRRAGHAQLNAIAALVLVLCWMNPLVHVALRWFRLDQELACDAAIVQRSNKSARIYGAALLRAQTGLAPPLGCSWRPANGLKTRIEALGMAHPVGAARWMGGVGLAVLVAGVGAASWAVRPDTPSAEPSLPFLADGASDLQAQPVTSNLARIALSGVDGEVTIIAEPRADIAFEGLAGEAMTRREGRTMFVQVSDLPPDVCNQGAPGSQSFTVRVPEGVVIDVEGSMDARIIAPTNVSLRARGCGSVGLGDVQGALTLDLGGDLGVNGGRIAGPLTLNAGGTTTIDLVQVDGPIEIQTEGGVMTGIEALDSGGRIQLSGGSGLNVEEWHGDLWASLSGGSAAKIEAITALRASITVSGSASGHLEDGVIADLHVDQAANATFFYGGQAERSQVRNRGNAPVVLRNAGQLDSQGRVSTVGGPPVD